jgi:hypothetical protein
MAYNVGHYHCFRTPASTLTVVLYYFNPTYSMRKEAMSKINTGIRCRNYLLLTAAILVCIAIAQGYRPRENASSTSDVLVLLLIIGGGFFAAKGIREFAGLMFDLSNVPWYARVNAALFIMAMLTGINVILLGMARAFSDSPGFYLVMEKHLIFLVSASTLIWIILLDWPECEEYTVSSLSQRIITLLLSGVRFFRRSFPFSHNKKKTTLQKSEHENKYMYE